MDTAADIIKRDITPFLSPGAEIWISFFADSQDPIYLEISQRFLIAKGYNDYLDMMRKVISTGSYANLGASPWCFEDCTKEFRDWYRSSDTISIGNFQYSEHLTNKKWPLKKVL